MPANLRTFLENLGYTDMRIVAGKVCGLYQFMFTTGIVVGLDAAGYERRYCFENRHDALAALKSWDGIGHPPGPWIKLKGAMNGCMVDLVNPAFGQPTFGRVAA